MQMVTMAMMTAIIYEGDGDAGQPLIVPLLMVIMVMMALMMVMMIVIVIMVMVMSRLLTLWPARSAVPSNTSPYAMLQQRSGKKSQSEKNNNSGAGCSVWL